MPRPASRLHGKGPTALGRICSCGRLARPPLPLPPLYPTWRSRYPRGETMLLAFFDILQLLLTVLTWIIIIQAILSWLVDFNVINTYNDLVRSLLNALDRSNEQPYRPIRHIPPDLGGIDLTPPVVGRT